MITIFSVVIGMTSAARFMAQSGSSAPVWETLVRTPMPADIDPVISINGLTMPAEPVSAHSHPGQTVAYLVTGEIENQVAPDPPAILKPGSYFYEAPRQLHKMMRNISTEPATLLIFHPGRAGVPASYSSRCRPRRSSYTATVYHLVALAYGKACITANNLGLISGGPDWMKKDAFNIQATLPAGSPLYTFQQLNSGEAPKLQATVRWIGAQIRWGIT